MASIDDKLETLVEISIKNIEEDRSLSKDGVDEINNFISKNQAIDPESFSKIMLSYSKLVENLQKSNEQIINIVNLKSKTKKPDDNPSSLTEEERQSLMRK